MTLPRLLAPVALSLTLLAVSASAAGEKIAVIPKGTTHSFWKSVEAGARQAGAEFGVEILWKGPLKEDDRAQQIGVVQQFVASNVDAIVLAPLDDTALRTPVKSAMDRHIPVVIFDSGLKAEAGKDFVSFVATDNHLGGKLAGEELVRLLGGKGKVVLLRYSEGSASTAAREAGFLEVLKAHPDIELLVENRYAGATIASAQDAAMNLIDKIRAADGVFAPNESSTQGLLLALRQTGLAGQKKFVGFDATPSSSPRSRRATSRRSSRKTPRRWATSASRPRSATCAARKSPPSSTPAACS
ncbi:substrate-binding domain-containing protein [Oleiharenicola sp. Vm1]|uniref:substrate-binding domain-containing protein n=1 Tax=Oleiharenicola sp. Vm1 TaxID=3398393 RepID=UPI0039F559E1